MWNDKEQRFFKTLIFNIIYYCYKSCKRKKQKIRLKCEVAFFSNKSCISFGR